MSTDVHVADPTVLFDGTIYQMWYTGHDGSRYIAIGYAISTDGIMWEKHSDNPVLGLGSTGTWDDDHVAQPTVLFDGTEYQMWYQGSDGSNYRIGYATSIPDSPEITIKTDKDIYNPWERVQVLADVDNPGSSFSGKLVGGIIVFRTPPKKLLILTGDTITKTINPGLNPNIALYVSKPAITGLLAIEGTHGAFGVLYTDEGLMAIDTSTWGLKGPPSVAQEEFFFDFIQSYIDKHGIKSLAGNLFTGICNCMIWNFGYFSFTRPNRFG